MEAVKERLATYLDPKDLAGAMEMLGERGWEATESIYADRAKEAKQSWRAITARNYGVRVAADWRPDGWLADFDHLTVQQAEERVTNARDALNALHRVQAVSEAEQEAAESAKAQLPNALHIMETLKAKGNELAMQLAQLPINPLRADIANIENEITADNVQMERQQVCPHCNTGLAVRNGKFVLAEDVAVIEARCAANVDKSAELQTRLHELEKQAAPIGRELEEINAKIRTHTTEANILEREAAKSGTVQTEGDRAALAQTEQEVEDAREVVKMVSAEADAARLHETICRYVEIAKALGPEGVRAKLLEDGLRKLNGGLATIAKASGLAANGSQGQRQHHLRRPAHSNVQRKRTLAHTEQPSAYPWRAITKSKCAVLDRVDMLDDANRMGLTKAVERVTSKTGMSVLLCGTGAVGDRYAPWTQVGLQSGEVVTA